METSTLGFIGGGRVTKIFLQAFANKKATFEKIVVFDINADVLSSLKSTFPQAKSVAEIIKPVSTEIKVQELMALLNSLVLADKIISTSSGGYLPKLPSYKDIKTSHVDWSMLGSIVESKFI